MLYAMVAPSYLPSREQSELRKLTRQRTKLLADQTRHHNRILKELEASGVKLASVVSDCLGKNGRAIIDALLAKKMSLDQIADLALGTLRKKIPPIRRAIEGSFTSSTEMVLQQLLGLSDIIETKMAALEQQIADLMKANAPQQALAKTIPGLRDTSSAAVLAECGTDMSLFPSSKHLTAWAGLSPGSNESAGKHKPAPARQGNKYLRTILVQCAWSAVRMKQGFWPTVFRRLCSRLGPKKAIAAIARKMLVALFHILTDNVPYRDPTQNPPSEQQRKRLARRLEDKLKALGYAVTLAPAADVS